MAKKSTPIPGLSFSWKRALGITQAKQKIARSTGIPTSKAGLEHKIGKTINKFLGKGISYNNNATSYNRTLNGHYF